MNLANLMADLPPDDAPRMRGQWFNIRWKPNLSTGELLNVGVAFRADDGGLHYRLLNSFERIKCLYDASLAKSAQMVLAVVDNALSGGLERIPSPHVVLSEEKPASGDSPEDILNGLFDITVPLAAPKRAPVPTQAGKPYATADDVREAVFEALRVRAGVSADRILNPEARMEVADGHRHHYLDIPLHAHNRLGSVISARGTRQESIDARLGRAETDLLVARKIYRSDLLYLYVVRDSVSGSAGDEQDDRFDEFAWKLGRLDIHVRPNDNPMSTAEDVMEDFGLALLH